MVVHAQSPVICQNLYLNIVSGLGSSVAYVPDRQITSATYCFCMHLAFQIHVSGFFCNRSSLMGPKKVIDFHLLSIFL